MEEPSGPSGGSYTLAELSAEVARRLGESGVEPASARVSAVPDGRTLRYYTTIGLLDRPLEVRDRQARYGEHHVLQALAIKSLQAAGHSLGSVQSALAGLGDLELAAVAAAGGGQDRARGRGRFWARPAPAPAAAPRAVVRGPEPLPAGAVQLQTTIPLAPGCELVLEGHWSGGQLHALRNAAAPLAAAWAALAGAARTPISTLTPDPGAAGEAALAAVADENQEQP